jgi:NAD(P)-dependent dehydrogenase (short-subunit alcohol dehydrogenase family)
MDKWTGHYLVFGAAGGIGSTVTNALRERGASCVALDLDEVDATNFDAVDACFKKSSSPVTGVVNCVGSILLKPAHATSEDEWSDTITRNLTSAFAIVRAAGRHMKKGGSVVLFSSVAAEVGLANHEAIAAAKGGVAALVRSAAATYAGRGLRFNAVSPGLVRTPMTERLTANEKQADAIRKMHPLGRLGEPDDIAAAVMWLLDPATSWVTGQTISVDGGMSTVRSRG